MGRAVHGVDGHEGEEDQEQEDSQGEAEFEATCREQEKDQVEQEIACVEVREGKDIPGQGVEST